MYANGVFIYGDFIKKCIQGIASYGCNTLKTYYKNSQKTAYAYNSGLMKSVNCSNDYTVYIPITTKHAYSKLITVDSYVYPISKKAVTQGFENDVFISQKGPTKSATVELVSSDSNVGTGTSNLSGVELHLAVNQFISLKVDIQGAKVNNLPLGFKFINNEIVGAASAAGVYTCNIISGSVSVPVKFNVTNVIRIT